MTYDVKGLRSFGDLEDHTSTASQPVKSAVSVVISYVEQLVTGDLIVNGRLPNEPDIGRIVGVSRTPVREAMKILDAIGIIEIRRGVGTFVRPNARSLLGYFMMFQQATIAATPEQLLETRLMVEHTAAELASIRSGPLDIRKLRLANDELLHLAQSANRDLEAITEADIAFHKAVFDACGNPLIAAIGKLTIEQVRPSVRLTNKDEGPMKSVKIHDALISAIENHDIAEVHQSSARRAVKDGLVDWQTKLTVE
jgi:DNA-binding FadR family transcriptional regulator